jgi:hypothetical protein
MIDPLLSGTHLDIGVELARQSDQREILHAFPRFT